MLFPVKRSYRKLKILINKRYPQWTKACIPLSLRAGENNAIFINVYSRSKEMVSEKEYDLCYFHDTDH